MEGASNGKNEETKTVERQEVVEVVDAGNKSVKEVVIDSTAESMKETIDENNSSLRGSNSSKEEAEAKEKTVQVEDSGTLEVVEKEEVNLAVGSTESVEERLTEATEALVGKSDDSDVAEVEVEVEVKETKEKVLVPLKETGVFPSVVTDQNDAEIPEVVLLATDGSSLSVTDGSSLAVTDEVSEGIEEKVLKSFDENNAAPPALTDAVSKGIEEKKLTALEESTGESSCNVDKEAVENFQSADVVGSSDAFPESTRDPPVTSLQQRNLCPCWRSCCGLFEALGRSDR